MDDAEPTQAADVPDDETQSIHAWSQSDEATEPAVYTPPRSWRIPVMLAAIAISAVAAASGVAHHASETHSTPAPTAAPTPSIAPAPPPRPPTPDERFLALAKQRGVQIVSPSLAITAGRDVCTYESQGYSDPEIAQAFVRSTPGTDLRTESIFVDTAKEVYCP